MDAKVKSAHIWQRDDLDWYVEPERATEQLCAVEGFLGSVIDPCCGIGNIPRTLIKCGVDAWGSDIVQRIGGESWFLGCADFLSDDWPYKFSNAVMNPPFFRAKGLEAFIRKAIATFPGKICVFGDVRFLAGASRANGLFREHPPQRVWIITPRLSCPPGKYLQAGGVAGNGSSDWCWMVWSHLEPKGETRLGWLRNEVAA